MLCADYFFNKRQYSCFDSVNMEIVRQISHGNIPFLCLIKWRSNCGFCIWSLSLCLCNLLIYFMMCKLVSSKGTVIWYELFILNKTLFALIW